MHKHATMLGRRAFLKNGSLVLATVSASAMFARDLLAGEGDRVRFSLVTDLHHADKPALGSRYYRETLGKLAQAAAQFQQDKPSFVVELGDLIDAADSVDVELGYLARVNREFSAISPNRHYVLGNHCVDMLTKDEFLGSVGQQRSYYSFDQGGLHFVVLDSCFRADGEPYGRKNFQWTDANLPRHELQWLAADLTETPRKVVVFAHQRLDVTDHYSVKNAAEARAILEASGKVLAVFQGHSHQNDYQDIAGIHYCTLAAMIEGSGPDSSGYSTVDVQPSGAIRVTGFRRQKSYDWLA